MTKAIKAIAIGTAVLLVATPFGVSIYLFVNEVARLNGGF